MFNSIDPDFFHFMLFVFSLAFVAGLLLWLQYTQSRDQDDRCKQLEFETAQLRGRVYELEQIEIDRRMDEEVKHYQRAGWYKRYRHAEQGIRWDYCGNEPVEAEPS